MRPSVPVMLALLWQSSLLVDLRAPARPEHLRLQRAVHVQSNGSGVACFALDATVLAHTASADQRDLRLFRQRTAGEPESEVPYTLTESGPEPVAETAATVERVAIRGNQVSFDLRMPARLYSEVRLRLRLRDFVATASVRGRDRQGRDQALGSVPVYDLSGRHLGHWTDLLLAESAWPTLHITLDVRTPEGLPWGSLANGVVLGAEVPPSRLRQTRYVATVSTERMAQRDGLSVALLRVPAHVPVERVAFTLSPGFGQSFAREVTVSARADGAPITDTEALDAGQIAHVSLPSGDPRLYPISVREDALDATLGATLARPATVLVAIDDAGNAPLPIRSVMLEMRERKLCFFADRKDIYVLRYGDPALAAPAFDESALAVPAQVLPAELGAERRNPGFHARPEDRNLWSRHPELFWLVLLFSSGTMVITALHHVQQRRG